MQHANLLKIFALTLFTTVATAHDSYRGRADKHAPAGLMGDHLHKTGEWMVEYKYMNMYMDGNRAG
ncbi:MAG: transporter, partial [Rubripirellula sp.]|nr:transporter [Rubripirellula sp.]